MLAVALVTLLGRSNFKPMHTAALTPKSAPNYAVSAASLSTGTRMCSHCSRNYRSRTATRKSAESPRSHHFAMRRSCI
ncbi:hypothetical protein PR001_g2948 [Phytophthora rubi]|uniref:Uncharacterized protein n=1 Tax=Phytophthora rubi TaxID=129364 RepID=A0A6A3PBL2_9STRA|nr:hypothetical protein PR001_g2948 [Phytophthora rubi]